MNLRHALATATVTAHFDDGQTLDLTGLQPEEAIAAIMFHVVAWGVTLQRIEHRSHGVRT